LNFRACDWVGTTTDTSKNIMKIAKIVFAVGRGFWDRMARYLYSSDGPGGRKSNSGHIFAEV